MYEKFMWCISEVKNLRKLFSQCCAYCITIHNRESRGMRIEKSKDSARTLKRRVRGKVCHYNMGGAILL